MWDRRLRMLAGSIAIAALPAGTSAGSLPASVTRTGVVPRAAVERPGAATRRRDAASCSSNGSGGFVGGGASNVAGGANSGVLSGQTNRACDQLSVIGGGDTNTIFGNGGSDAEESFIGAGANNYVSSYHSGIGAGYANTVSGTNAFLASGNINDIGANHAFIGSGDFNAVTGSGSFIGAGDYEYFLVHGGLPFGNQVSGVDSFIGAGDLNVVNGSGSFIGAGDFLYAQNNIGTANQVQGYDSFLGAGDQNDVGANEAFIGSGGSNLIGTSGTFAAIAGGTVNTASAVASFIGSGTTNSIGSGASYASILGGGRNSVAGQYASVLGGYGNAANGAYAIVAGGNSDSASGILSYAAGYHASAGHNGSFVWSDYASGSAKLQDTASNQFLVRASGGVFLYSNEAASAGVELAPGAGTWSSLSDRNAKTDIVPLDDSAILAKVAALPVDAWRYKTQSGVRHVGPMAQDFYAAFGVGEDDRHITSIDEDGVALAAVKAVNAKLDRENGGLRANEARDENEISALHRELRRIEATLAAR
jgi:hypothetical protein